MESQAYKVECTKQGNYRDHEEAYSRNFYPLSLAAAPSNFPKRTNNTDCNGSAIQVVLCDLTEIQSAILVLIRHFNNLFKHIEMHYQLFIYSQGIIIRLH